jgi:hypothetical protein
VTADLFRLVNDRIHELGPPSLAEFDFVCECAHEGCTDSIRMTEAEYEAARADIAQFAVLPGHEPAFSEIVARTDRYVLVKKHRETLAARAAV